MKFGILCCDLIVDGNQSQTACLIKLHKIQGDKKVANREKTSDPFVGNDGITSRFFWGDQHKSTHRNLFRCSLNRPEVQESNTHLTPNQKGVIKNYQPKQKYIIIFGKSLKMTSMYIKFDAFPPSQNQ